MEITGKMISLAKELEALHPDVAVVDMVETDRNIYTVKVQTPIGVYITEGSAGQIRQFVKRDVEAVGQFHCAFCKTPLTWSNQVSHGQCPYCNGYFAKGHDELITALKLNDLSVSHALGYLDQFSTLFIKDPIYRLVWGRAPKSADCDNHAVFKIEGPEVSSALSDVPVLLNVEIAEDVADELKKTTKIEALCEILADEDQKESITFPTCELCVHCAMRPGSPDLNEDIPMCAYPLNGLELAENFFSGSSSPTRPTELYFMSERNKHGVTDGVAVIWNRLLTQVIDFIEEKYPDKPLKAFAPPPFNRFITPICSRFKLMKDHYSLDDFPLALLRQRVTLSFDVADLVSIKKAREDEQIIAQWQAVFKRMGSLKNNPEAAKLLSGHIGSRDIDRAPGIALITFLEREVPLLLRQKSYVGSRLSGYLNLSKKATMKLDRILRSRAEQQANHPF